MEQIILTTPSGNRSVITCGEGALQSAAERLSALRPFIVTDANVARLYGSLAEKIFPDAPRCVLPAGEKSKNGYRLFGIFKAMTEAGVTRGSTVVALGGGVVGDIAGLAASLYMRGVNLVQIPTTLLSQVDSSVGGKTAVDFSGVKNLIGSFYQPSEVIVDPLFLPTLPPRELRCGLGEIVKYGALDKRVFRLLDENIGNLFRDGNGGRSRKPFPDGVTEEIITRCIAHKANVVTEDEKDLTGARKTLNLGHTTGHAFELYYKRKSHGEFVLIGMYYELFIAQNKGVCAAEYADRLRRMILKVLGNVPAYADAEQAALCAMFDKKNTARTEISLVVPKEEGVCEEIVLPVGEYAEQIAACRDALRENRC